MVEDDRSTYNALRALFQRRGWDVIVATNVSQALAELDAGVESIILDLMLPDGDGTRILQAVRRLNLNLPVVITTGCNDPHRLDAARRLSPRAILHKPVDLTELYKLVEP